MLVNAIRFVSTNIRCSWILLLRIETNVLQPSVRVPVVADVTSCISFSANDNFNNISSTLSNSFDSSLKRACLSTSVGCSSWPHRSSSPRYHPNPTAIFLPSNANFTWDFELIWANDLIFDVNSPGLLVSILNLFPSRCNIVSDGTTKFKLHSWGFIGPSFESLLCIPLAFKPLKNLTPLPLNNFWTINQKSKLVWWYLML